MILAAGKGTRLGQLTEHTPKPLVPVGGRPMIWYGIERLLSLGVNELVINTHHHAEALERFVADNDGFGITVHISREAELLDTGGGVLFARRFLEDCDFFILHNADIYSEIDLSALIAEHTAADADATLAIQYRDTVRRLLFSPAGDLLGWENTDSGKKQVIATHPNEAPAVPAGFCGIHVINPRLFKAFESLNQSRFSIILAYLAAAEAGYSIRAFDIADAAWFDLGTPEKLRAIEAYQATRRKPT